MDTSKCPIFVISGWPWSEHEVSLVSGKTVFEETIAQYPNTHLVVISRDGSWKFSDSIKTESEGIDEIQRLHGIVFPIIHGTYGEDGDIQELLEERNIPFMGSPKNTMKLTIHKQSTGDFLSAKGFRTPKSSVISDISEILDMSMGFPMIVKPSDEGSSISLYKVDDAQALYNVVEKEMKIRKEVLVQEFVKWREFTCGVVEMNGEAIPLFPTEVILTKGDLFDYEAKYKAGWCQEITPAPVDAETLGKIQQTALAVHRACGCEDISRTDMILNSDGELVVLEINTIPGMTPTSFVPAQLRASGFSVGEFLHSMIHKYSR